MDGRQEIPGTGQQAQLSDQTTSRAAPPQHLEPPAGSVASANPPRRGLRRPATRVGIAAGTVLALGAGFGVGVAVRSSAAAEPVTSAPQQWVAGGAGSGGSSVGSSAAGSGGSSSGGSSSGGSSSGGSSSGGSSSGGSGSGGSASSGLPGTARRGGAFTIGGSTQASTSATGAQEAGVVDIDVVLGGNQRAAGTGMVLTSSGEVLTNRHVVEGETSITVTVAATGRTYAARVVGISTTTDVAVVQLVNASGLTTVKTASSAVQLADPVTGVGNAGGTGGTPSAAPGTVTGVGQAITAADTNGSNPERLTGLIETDAGIRAGDSGGPLLNGSNEVVGMDTAASATGNDAYAIPITTALTVARAIEAGATGTQAGAGTSTALTRRVYLGVQVQDGASGALVGAVVEGSPAQAAGLVAGDTITAVGGHPVTSAADLSSVMASASAGRALAVTWVDQGGARHTARVTPVAAG